MGVPGNTNSRIEIAKRKTNWQSWANGWDTVEGGTHKDACSAVFNELKWKPKHALVHIIMKEPDFAGPSKQKLNVRHIEQELIGGLRDGVTEYCQSRKRGMYSKNYRPESLR